MDYKDNPYPLAKPKFWARSIVALRGVLDDIGYDKFLPPVYSSSEASLIQRPWEFHRDALWDLGQAINKASWEYKRDWKRWHRLKDRLRSQEHDLDCMVLIPGACIGNRQASGVGQYVGMEHEPTGNRRYDYTDNGPLCLERTFVLRLLDGRIQRWWDASYYVIPTIREIELYGR